MKSKICWKTIMITMALMLLLNFTSGQAHAQSIQVSAKSAVLMEQETGRVIYEKDARTQRKIASITKIMTAILAIESDKLDDVVTINEEMIKVEGSAVYLQVGEKISLRDLVYGLMLRSGNDAAQAIAIYVGGSQTGFVQLMNEKAAWIGMNQSSFANPHGLDDDHHYSTAYDMALLTRYAMNDPEFQKISATKSYTTDNPDGGKRVWKNKNKMLAKYKYSTGGKTGFTKKARRTLVSTAKKDQMALIAVTLDASSDWNDHQHMFETAFVNYHMEVIVPEGAVKNLTDKIYQKHVFLKTPIYYPVTGTEKENLAIQYELLKPQTEWKTPKDVPNIVGRVNILQDNKLLATKPLYYQPEPIKESFLEIWRQLFHRDLGI